MDFACFVALDWSGARQANGIAVAVCTPGRGVPRLVPPPGGRRWSRLQALEWVSDLVARERAPIGFDFAFSLPFVLAQRYFTHADPSVQDLWALVEEVGGEASDLWGGGFAGDARYASDFWRSGRQPRTYRDPHRATDQACRMAGLGSPQSPYKLIGAKQVGLGALAGMRVLHRLQTAVAVWPFAAPNGSSAVVEIYPRLFLRRAGAGNAKVRDWSDLKQALAALGSRSPRARGQAPSDHDTDALVSAAGLRALAGEERVWDAPRHDQEALRREGWIFGVPRP
ncbi:MAG: hypothetical protein FJX60_05360 [Alphaproteobacteria bacterium]|nr:hypothetical protein [Alphaproteobacteria bacterium]